MIPHTFTLVNRTWVVRICSHKQFKRYAKVSVDGECQAFCDPDKARIVLDRSRHTTREYLEHSFWHEFVHALKFSRGEHQDHDEVEVDGLGALIHQFLKTSEGSQ